MEVGSLVVVSQDFISELDEELNLLSGDVAQVEQVVDKLWFRGSCNGVSGKFPRSFVRERALPPGFKDGCKLFAALADFPAGEDGDLGFSRGDLLVGTGKVDGNWWSAEDSDGRKGIIPLSHIWEVDASKLPKEEASVVNRMARVILTMKAQLEDELDLLKDEIITVRRIIDKDWYWGEKNPGVQGRFPKGFVTLLDEVPKETTPLPDLPPSFQECTQQIQMQVVEAEIHHTESPKSNRDNTYENLTDLSMGMASAYDSTGEGYGGGHGIQPYARTKYKFSSQYPNELSFDVGQIVNLIRHIDEEWTEGEIKGKIGLFPTEYVDIIVDVAHDLPKIAGTLAKALYTFESDVTGDLKLKEGEVVIILDKLNDEWYKARNSMGDVGICPVSYVQEIDSAAPPTTVPKGAPPNDLSSNRVQSLPLSALSSLSQQHVISWLATSSPPAAPSVVSSDSGGDAAADNKSVKKEKKDLKSQASSPDEEDFSWDFGGSPEHDIHPTLFTAKATSSLPLYGGEYVLTPTEGEKPIVQFVPARPPPPPPVTAAKATQRTPQRPAPPVPVGASSRYDNTVDPKDSAAQSAAREMVQQQKQLDSKLRKQREHRQCVITEIIQTEKDYNLDLKLCYDTFLKEPTQARRLGIDVVTLFGNLDEVIDVSSQLLKAIESEMKKNEDEQVIGRCFFELAAKMQDIYGHYCRNHDDVNGLLAKYEQEQEVWRYLQNGVELMKRTSNCFDLASVVIKPVQRILKYPLLINELEKSTEDSHPDKRLLLQAMDEMSRVATDINEVKRRKDLVSKYRRDPEASLSQRLSKFNLHSVMKKSSRLTVKVSNSLGFTTVVRDEDFEKEEHRFILLEKSIKNCLKSLRIFCEQLHECLHVALQLSEDVCDVFAEKCNLPEVDRFRTVQHTVYAEYWLEFTKTIDKQVIDTLNSALVMLAAPHKIIGKRYHKLLDLAACTARLEKNRDATRLKAFEEEEQAARNMYQALNSQLLDELPKLCSICCDLLRSCVDTFLRARKVLIGRITTELLALSELPGLQSASGNLIETFEVKHRAAIQAFAQFTILQPNLSNCMFKMESFGKSSSFLRKSFNEKHTMELVPQTDAVRNRLISDYWDNCHAVAITIQTSDPTEISLTKGDLVGVIRQTDPSGNPMRWFVDNGRVKGLIASKHLLRETPTTSMYQNRAALRPTSLTGTGSSNGVANGGHPSPPGDNGTAQLALNPKAQAAVNGEGIKVLPSYPSNLTLQPSKRVVNPVISNLPNRSQKQLSSSGRSNTLPTALSNVRPNDPFSPTASTQANPTAASKGCVAPLKPTKPLPALPLEDNTYSNIDALNNCDTDPRGLIDVRTRLDEYYYALYKLEDVGAGQLPLTQGQVVLVIYTSDLENNTEWWFVEDRYGKQGYVPASYLRKYKTA